MLLPQGFGEGFDLAREQGEKGAQEDCTGHCEPSAKTAAQPSPQYVDGQIDSLSQARREARGDRDGEHLGHDLVQWPDPDR